MKKYLWLFNISMVRCFIYLFFSLSISILYYFIFDNIYISLGLFIFIFGTEILCFELSIKNIDKNKNKELEIYSFILNYHDTKIIKNERIKESKIYSKKLNELIAKESDNRDEVNLKNISLYFACPLFDEFLKEINSLNIAQFIKDVAFKYEFLNKKFNDLSISLKKNIYKFTVRETIFYSLFSLLYFGIFIIDSNFINNNIFKIIATIPLFITLLDCCIVSIFTLIKNRRNKDDEK